MISLLNTSENGYVDHRAAIGRDSPLPVRTSNMATTARQSLGISCKFVRLSLLSSGLLCLLTCPLQAQDAGAAAFRRRESQQFHLRSQQRTGVLVPLYVYPDNIEHNEHYNRLIELRRRFETVPIWVIVNPASGPGEQVDPNYTRAIRRLIGSGCVVLGYVTTSYGKRSEKEVLRDIKRWLALYPDVQGIFFDEMNNADTDVAAEYHAALNRSARDAGCWPTVANPGADTPARYFDAGAADVIIIHEGTSWPAEQRLKGAVPGGYGDYPPFHRGILLHSQPVLDLAELRTARQYVRWIYVTDDVYRPGDPQADNPWDTLSSHLAEMLRLLSEN